MTGSLVIIPKTAIPALEKVAEQSEFVYDWKPLVHKGAYVELTWKAASNAAMVSVLTAVFELGEINCIIGTALTWGRLGRTCN